MNVSLSVRLSVRRGPADANRYASTVSTLMSGSKSMSRKPTAFISYSSKDSSIIDKVATDLRSAGIGVWFDKWDIRVGESILQ